MGAAASAGFTLVELLVALTLLGLMAVLMHGGLRFGGRVWETGSERIEEAAQVQSAQAFLRRQLHQAIRPFGEDDDEAVAGSFVGSLDALRFVAPLPDYVASWARYRHALRVTEDSGRRDLIVSWRRLQEGDDATNDDQGQGAVLLRDVKEVELGYFGRDEDARSPARWRDRWQDEPELPRLIRIRVRFDDDDPRYWPELVVSPKLDGGG